jgi:predicted ribosome quality control (RQC) complex YloA/Tae2 family protein
MQLDVRKSLHENAADYYEKAKRARAKAQRLVEEIKKTERELEAARAAAEERPAVPARKREREWFEKFHWTRTSDSFLVLAGRDAKQNQLLVKNYMKPGDFFLHADVQGAPATIVQSEGREVTSRALEEAAVIAAVFSKGWKSGTGALDVFAVAPGQVKTAAKAGEFLAKGSFVIVGERRWLRDVPLRVTLGFDSGKQRPFVSAARLSKSLEVVPGKMEKSDLAKLARKKFSGLGFEVGVDELLQVLPAGGALA